MHLGMHLISQRAQPDWRREQMLHSWGVLHQTHVLSNDKGRVHAREI
jgi:hypothetical protein